MEFLGLALRVLGSGAAATVTEERLGMSHQLLLPVLDLIGVNVEVLGELGQGSVPSHGKAGAKRVLLRQRLRDRQKRIA